MLKFNYLFGDLLIERYKIYDATNEQVGALSSYHKYQNVALIIAQKKTKKIERKSLISELKRIFKMLAAFNCRRT